MRTHEIGEFVVLCRAQALGNGEKRASGIHDHTQVPDDVGSTPLEQLVGLQLIDSESVSNTTTLLGG